MAENRTDDERVATIYIPGVSGSKVVVQSAHVPDAPDTPPDSGPSDTGPAGGSGGGSDDDGDTEDDDPEDGDTGGSRQCGTSTGAGEYVYCGAQHVASDIDWEWKASDWLAIFPSSGGVTRGTPVHVGMNMTHSRVVCRYPQGPHTNTRDGHDGKSRGDECDGNHLWLFVEIEP